MAISNYSVTIHAGPVKHELKIKSSNSHTAAKKAATSVKAWLQKVETFKVEISVHDETGHVSTFHDARRLIS